MSIFNRLLKIIVAQFGCFRSHGKTARPDIHGIRPELKSRANFAEVPVLGAIGIVYNLG